MRWHKFGLRILVSVQGFKTRGVTRYSTYHKESQGITKYHKASQGITAVTRLHRVPAQSITRERMESQNPESGIRNRNRNLTWDQGKLGSTETSPRYPCGNKIQNGVLCYHCFEEFSAQWSWYQRCTHIRKVTDRDYKKPIDCEKQPLLVCDV